ncbi:hypothetical protein [Rhodopirellula sp. MGV]|uniref:hypothetical protein n=1 Tax=Rhodopirellula sp. MGV TaxID=2023130 RepID=UPI00117B2018|nr:hypothetical protein [Rhodopirellula sp. MGV]
MPIQIDAATPRKSIISAAKSRMDSIAIPLMRRRFEIAFAVTLSPPYDPGRGFRQFEQILTPSSVSELQEGQIHGIASASVWGCNCSATTGVTWYRDNDSTIVTRVLAMVPLIASTRLTRYGRILARKRLSTVHHSKMQ